MHVTSSYILQKKKSFIKKYKKTWRTDVSIRQVPVDVTEENIDDILRIMIDTGYTFIVSCEIYRNSEKSKQVINMSDIIVPDWLTVPRPGKIASKVSDIIEGCEIKTVVINTNHEILDGYATFLALRRLGEKYVIYEVNDYAVTKQRRGSTENRLKLYEAQGGRCYICGRMTKLDPKYENYDDFATVDHIVPVSKGGDNRLKNLALCCKLCNNLKGNFRYSKELKEVILMELKERELI